VKAGTYSVRLTTRSQAGTASQATLALVVQATEPALSSTADTNGDGIVDSIEGYLDAYGKAIPAYLDSDPGAPQALQTVPPGSSSRFTPYLEAQQGDRLRLGPTVLATGRVSGATVTAADVAAYGDGSGAPSNGTDTYTNVGGLFDFEVHGVAPGGTAQIVLPLQSAIRSGAVYRQYSAAAGWHDFVGDASNSLASAHSSGGVCPGPGSTAYTAGLTAFNDCVRLTIQDGGPDDEDGVANGVVRDPGGVAVAPSSSATPGTPKPSAGAFAPWVLLGLLAAWARRRRRPINQGIR
jgi:MYXO-CTERM domain-containing protein